MFARASSGNALYGAGQRGIPPAVPRVEAAMGIITEEVIKIETYINRTWQSFQTEKEVPLRKLFPRPSNPGLLHIWRYGAADLVVSRVGNPIAIIEVGGSHHWEEKQMTNDSRKWKLCSINNVRCLRMTNGMQVRLSGRKWRALLGSYLFGVQPLSRRKK
jgi:hypothetical protein